MTERKRLKKAARRRKYVKVMNIYRQQVREIRNGRRKGLSVINPTLVKNIKTKKKKKK